MNKVSIEQVQNVAADAAAGVSVASASYAWLGTANDLMTLLATGVAVVAGILAARYHWVKTKQLSNGNPSDDT